VDADARIIMGDDEANLVRLWREKRGEVEPEDLSDNLMVQLGSVTEDLNRRWGFASQISDPTSALRERGALRLGVVKSTNCSSFRFCSVD
jgi:hypothetical protein